MSLFFFLSCLAVAINADRALYISLDKVNPTNNLYEVLDIQHQAMLEIGFYTVTDVEAMENNAISFIKQQFGLDFGLGTRNPYIGSLALPEGTMYPYKSGVNYDFKVVYDSKYVNRGRTENWYMVEFGKLILMNTQGTFASGNTTGSHYYPGDILAYTEINLLRADSSWSLSANREVIAIRSLSTTKQILNADNNVEQHIKLEAIDENGNLGYYTDIVTVDKTPTGTTQHNRVSITF